MIDRQLRSHFKTSFITAAVAVAMVTMAPPARGKPRSRRRSTSIATCATILSNNCYACHGPDKNKRKADLRLDTQEGITAVLEDRHVTVPGHPEKSELFLRVTSADPDERMPDPKSNKKLSNRDIAVLKKWIEQGANWKGHWAYLKPAKPEVPACRPDDQSFVQNPVDRFILAKLKENGLHPRPRRTGRRCSAGVSFDLTGLPPTPKDVDAFVNDKSTDAYEKQVDRLMASPHFGERMAMYWLDLVRYADSIGYHSDNPMNVSPYRDWVINAFNQNEPFDRFTTEQLAGDLLPDASRRSEQKVACAYNRLLQTTEEGGAQAEGIRGEVRRRPGAQCFDGLARRTMGCCQCHDHKFDPFSTKDFYSMAAFFADVQEASDRPARAGHRRCPTPHRPRRSRNSTSRLPRRSGNWLEGTPELAAAQAEWEKHASSTACRPNGKRWRSTPRRCKANPSSK